MGVHLVIQRREMEVAARAVEATACPIKRSWLAWKEDARKVTVWGTWWPKLIATYDLMCH